MAETTARPRQTAQHPFFSANPQGDLLFSVRADIPATDALEQASCFLSAARSAVYEAAEGSARESMYGAAYLVDMAKAIVDSAILSLDAEEAGNEPS